MTIPIRRYGGKSGEERAAERRERLLSAALDIVAGHGAAKLTVTGLCAAAGLSERYFYESFPDRSALLDAIFDRISRQSARAVVDATELPDADRRGRAAALVQQLVDMMLDDARLSTMALESRTDEGVMRGRAATAQHLAVVIEEHADRFWDVDGADPVRVQARALAAIGGIADLLVAWREGGLAMAVDELIDEATGFFLAAGEGLRPAAARSGRRRTPVRITGA